MISKWVLPFQLLPNEWYSSKSEDSINEGGLLLLLAVGQMVELVFPIEVGQKEGLGVQPVTTKTE